MRRACATILAAGLIAWLCVARWHQVAGALAAVPALGFGLAVALHVAVLGLRSEAWRVALAAIAKPALPRRTIHTVNAHAFLAGCVQTHAALPARVLLLGRAAHGRPLRPSQIGLADAPIFLLELLCTGVLLAAGLAAGRGEWWAGPGAVVLAAGALLAARTLFGRAADGQIAQGLAVLGDTRRRTALLGLVAAITAITAGRIWLILGFCDLPQDLGTVTTVFAALGAFGLLPLGPAGSPGATVAAVGASGVGAAVAAGLVVSASSIAAVLVYAAAATGARSRDRHRTLTVCSPAPAPRAGKSIRRGRAAA